MSRLAYVAAVVVFVLAALGVTVGDSSIDLIALGLALFAVGHAVP